MRRLIVNADDFGLTEKVNQAIVECHEKGIVTSASLLANGAAFESAVALARRHKTLAVGAHLNLTEGRPVSSVRAASALVGSDGGFSSAPLGLARKVFFRKIGPADIETELRAQIEKILGAGLEVTHLDGHKHIHLVPAVFETVLRLAKEYRIPSVRCPVERPCNLVSLIRRRRGERLGVLKQYMLGRALAALAAGQKRKLARAGLHCPSHFFGITQTGFLDTECLAEILEELPEGISEIMCHPGYVDASLRGMPTRLFAQREMELKALTRPEIKALVTAHEIELIGYGALGRDDSRNHPSDEGKEINKLERDVLKSA